MYKGFRFVPLLLLTALFGCDGDTGGGGGVGSAPQITSFTANPESITAPGQAVALSWTVTNGVTSLEIDGGVGPVSGTSQVVYPTAATTYTLTAANSSGETSASVSVGLGTGPAPGPGVEDGLPPSGTFGVSLSQGDFQSDQGSNIEDASDPRIIRVQAGGTFYALVSYSDPGGIAGATIFIANSSPPELRADLVQGQEVGGFTLNGEVSGCVLDGTQTSVTCIYEIAVGSIPNITELPGVSGEFAYVFRTRVTDAAGNMSDSPPRGYVIVGDSGSGGGGGGTPTNGEPTAAFTVGTPTTVSGGVSYKFSAAQSIDPDGDTLSYAWSFGDNTGANTRDYTKKYTKDGTYTVKLTVSDGKGGSATETKTVEVDVLGSSNPPGNPLGNPPENPPGNPPATAPTITSFTANPAIIGGGQSSTLMWKVTGTVTSLQINRGVGSVLGAESRQVSPTATTTYTLTAANGAETATKQTTVTVSNGGGNPPPSNSSPNADFTTSSSNLQVEFASTSSDPDGSIASYAWAFGDNTSSTVQSPSKTYSEAGTYNVKLTVTDNNGATGSVTKPVTVTAGDQGPPPTNSEPTAKFSAEVNNLQVVFTSTSTDSDGTITSFMWSLGDGTTENAPSFTKTYNQAGTYDVALTVTDNAGASNSVTKPVTVNQSEPQPNQAPNADFSAEADGLFVNFTSTSTDLDGTIENYSWSFGDGETADTRDSSKLYDSAGTYTVNLAVTDDRGATDSITQSITVEDDSGGGGGGGCCRTCTTGKPCGDSCIARNKVCRKPPGCACSALKNPQDFKATLEYQLPSGHFAFDLLTGRTKPCGKEVVPLVYAFN